MMRIILIASTFCLISLAAIGQKGDNKVWQLPVEYERSVEINDERPGQHNMFLQHEILTLSTKHEEKRDYGECVPWLVISDRDQNQLFTDQSLKTGNEQFAQIGEKLYVVNEVFNALEVVGLENAQYDINTACEFKPEKVQKRGWISKKNLVLWDRPLKSSSTQFELKAFLVNSDEESLSKIGSGEQKKDLVQLYSSPTGTKPINEEQLYEVLFVYNYDPNTRRFLLGTEPVLSNANEKNASIFWVSTNRMKTWNTRVALEWNYDKDACEERQSNDLKSAIFFDNPGKAEQQRDGKYTMEQFRNNDYLLAIDPCSSMRIDGINITENRYSGDVMRLPYFGRNTDYQNVVNCGAIMKLSYSSDLKGYVPVSNWAELKHQIESNVRSGKYVNCMLVVQGNEKIYKLKDQLTKVVDSFSELGAHEEFNGKVKVGAVIYRNKRDAKPLVVKEPSTEAKEIQALKEELGKLENFYNEGNASCQSLMKMGMKTAMQYFQENQTNILIQIGMCGDEYDMRPPDRDPFYVPDAQLVQDVFKYNVNLLAIQAATDPIAPGASAKFTKDIDDIQTPVANNIDDKLQEFIEEKGSNEDLRLTSYEWRQRQIDGGYELRYLSDSHLSLARLAATDPRNASLAPAEISKQAKAFVEEIGRRNVNYMNFLEQLIYDDSNISQRAGEGGGEMAKLLVGMGLSPEEISILKEEKVQLLREGYTAFKLAGSEANQYKYVLFLERRELRDLIEKMEELRESGRSAMHAREALVNAWYEYAGAVLNEDPAELMNQYPGKDSRTLQSILRSGIPEITSGQRSIFSKYTAREIQIEGQPVTNDEIRAYIERLDTNIKRLTELYQNDDLIYKTKEFEFFWVNIDLLP